MKRVIFVIMLNILLIANILNADSGLTYPPSIGCIIGGTVSLDGKMIKDNESDNLTITIKTSDGKTYTLTNGMKNNYYSIEIKSGFGEEAEITVNYNGKKYYVISPSNGKFKICENLGEIKKLDLKISKESPEIYTPVKPAIEEGEKILKPGESIKGEELKGEIKGEVELPEKVKSVKELLVENIVKELPKLEDVEIKPEGGKIKVEKVVLKNAKFDIGKEGKIEFGKGVIFDKNTMKNLAEKIEKPLSIKEVLPEVEKQTKTVNLKMKIPATNFPLMVDENNNYKSPERIVEDVTKRFNIRLEVNDGLMLFPIPDSNISFSSVISDIRIGKEFNLFSETGEVEILKDGEFLLKQEELYLVLAPIAYDIEKLDEIFLKLKNEIQGFNVEILDKGRLIANWKDDKGEERNVILCFNGIVYTDNKTDSDNINYEEVNGIPGIKINYSEGKYEYMLPYFIGMEYLGKWLESNNVEWKFDRKKGMLFVEAGGEKLKVVPDIFYKELSEEDKEKLNNANDNVTFVNENNTWYIITPDGVQKFMFFQ